MAFRRAALDCLLDRGSQRVGISRSTPRPVTWSQPALWSTFPTLLPSSAAPRHPDLSCRAQTGDLSACTLIRHHVEMEDVVLRPEWIRDVDQALVEHLSWSKEHLPPSPQARRRRQHLDACRAIPASSHGDTESRRSSTVPEAPDEEDAGNNMPRKVESKATGSASRRKTLPSVMTPASRNRDRASTITNASSNAGTRTLHQLEGN